MITIKQIEALYWVHRLGSITAAAEKLHATQSAITKRIADLEQGFSVSLIDCDHRNARLTTKGLEVYQLGKELLKQRDLITHTLSEKRALTGRYRVGVTEFNARSWLPEFADRFRNVFPGIELEADVAESPRLRESLLDGGLDFAVLDASFQDLRLAATPLYDVELSWMCRPGLLEIGRTYRLEELAQFPLLSPGPASGLALIYDRLFTGHRVPQKTTTTAASLAALIALTRAGYGVCLLPPQHCDTELRTQALQVIVAEHPPIRIQFAGMFRQDSVLGIAPSVMDIARQCRAVPHTDEGNA